jgi:hypothetical protein
VIVCKDFGELETFRERDINFTFSFEDQGKNVVPTPTIFEKESFDSIRPIAGE